MNKIHLWYDGTEFELDIDGLCEWLDFSEGDRQRTDRRLNGSWGQPSTVWEAPVMKSFFSGMTDDQIVSWIESLVDGQIIGNRPTKENSASSKIREVISARKRHWRELRIEE